MKGLQTVLAAISLVLTLWSVYYALKLHKLMSNGPVTHAISRVDIWTGFLESLSKMKQ